MAHTIYAGNVSKRKNSTLQPTLTASFDVLLKTPTSLHTPTFTISASSFDYNYLKWGNRYYFVTDVVSRNNNLWDVSAVVDVLATYKAEILASTQFVSYSSVSGDTWLVDTRIPVLKSTRVSSNSSLTGILSTIGCYILSVVGKNSCVTYMIPTDAIIQSMLNEIQNWEDDGILAALQKIQTPTASYTRAPYHTPSSNNMQDCFESLCHTLTETFESIGNGLVDVQSTLSTALASVGESAIDTGFIGNAYLNAPSCIRSCIWVPFDNALAPTTGQYGNIFLGTYDTQIQANPIKSTPVTGSNTINIPWHFSDWRRSVCEDVYLYLPLVGMVQLSGDSLTHATSITINWSVTYTDGTISYKVEAGGEVIGAYGGQCSSNYPIGIAQQASAGEIAQSVIAGAEKVISGAINSSLSPASAGAVVGNAIMTGATTGYDVLNLTNTTHISSVGGIGGGAGIGLGRECICYTVAHDTVINPVDMKDTMGLPTMKPMSLSTLTGYCQCANAHVSAAAEAQELDEIDAFLNGGFYIE
jgi:hypothetical protein